MNEKYDFLVVGSGLYGSTVAHGLKEKGYKVLVIDKRDHVAGNIYTKEEYGISVHEYGAHIFNTSNEEIWKYINKFAKFNNFINSPLADYKGKYFHLPFNINTFEDLWNISDPDEIKKRINDEIEKENIKEITNLEEQAISLVGRTLYETLIKGYTEKQWGKKANELPSFIIKRIPVRFIRDNNYFNDKYQGIPIGGYTKMIENMLEDVDVILGEDYLENREKFNALADKIIYTGQIDKFYNYELGTLEYRSLRFEKETLNIESFQHNAVVNYTEYEVPYTRIIEHKYFENNKSKKTIITREYPDSWDINKEAYYPINNDKNSEILAKYNLLAEKEKNVFFGGRLGKYKYLDMDDTIAEAFADLENIIKKASK